MKTIKDIKSYLEDSNLWVSNKEGTEYTIHHRRKSSVDFVSIQQDWETISDKDKQLIAQRLKVFVEDAERRKSIYETLKDLPCSAIYSVGKVCKDVDDDGTYVDEYADYFSARLPISSE